MHQWENVNGSISRFVVPGGWMYSYVGSHRLCFVPEPNDITEGATYRAGYDRGHSEGYQEGVADGLEAQVKP